MITRHLLSILHSCKQQHEYKSNVCKKSVLALFKEHIQQSCYGDNVVRKAVHQHDSLVTVDIELVNKAEPVDHQPRAKP